MTTSDTAASAADNIRVGVIGIGRIATQAHLPVLAGHPRAQVTWVVNRTEDSAREAAERWGAKHWATDYRTLLDVDDLDAVDICLPGSLHADTSIAFLDRGVHALVEKPVALSLNDIGRMRQARDRGKAVLMVAENWPFSSAYQRAAQLLGRDGIGEILQLQARHESALRASPVAASEQVRGDRATLGYLFAAGIHSLNLARHLVGEITLVTGFATPATEGEYGLLDDDSVLATRFDTGAVGSFAFTGRSRHLGDRKLVFRAIADRGVVEFDVWSGCVTATIGGQQTTHAEEHPSMGYAEEIDHFLDCIRHQRTPLTSLEDQERTLASVLAAYRALQTATAVSPQVLLEGVRA